MTWDNRRKPGGGALRRQRTTRCRCCHASTNGTAWLYAGEYLCTRCCSWALHLLERKTWIPVR